MGEIKGGKMRAETTAFNIRSKEGRVMSGCEKWSIVGSFPILPSQIKKIIQQCVGLSYFWDCDKKAEVAKKVLGTGHIVMGSLMVVSADGKST